jgi:hypothetical protein
MAGRREHIQFQLNPLGGAALSATSPRTEKNRRCGLSASIAAGEPHRMHYQFGITWVFEMPNFYRVEPLIS